MMFLIRMAFWLSVVILLLPTEPAKQAPQTAQIGPGDAVSFATAAVADIGQFCNRQPDACVTGSHAAVAFGHKAQATAKLIYEFLTKRLGDDKTDKTDKTGELKTGSIVAPAQSVSQDTLTPTDRALTRQVPQPPRDPRGKRPA